MPNDPYPQNGQTFTNQNGGQGGQQPPPDHYTFNDPTGMGHWNLAPDGNGGFDAIDFKQGGNGAVGWQDRAEGDDPKYARYTNPRTNNGQNQWEDTTSYGGTARTYDKNGNLVPGSADVATQRYQTMGQAAADRNAYAQDYGNANQSRGQQYSALNLQQQAAMGNAPSQAQMLGRNMIDQSLQAQMAGAASSRGGSLAQAAAMRQAANGAAAQQQQGVNQLSALRAQEMAQARDAYMQGATGIRGMDESRVGMQSQNDQFQRQLNQQAQEYYEGMGNQVQEDQMKSSMGEHAIAEGGFESGRQIDEASTQALYKGIAGGSQGVGSMMAMASDARTKQDVRPMYSDADTKDETSIDETSKPPASQKVSQAVSQALSTGASNNINSIDTTPAAGRSYQAPSLDGRPSSSAIELPKPNAMYSDVGTKEVLPIGAEPEGKQLYIDDSGRGGYRAMSEPQERGASLSGPAPRYSLSQAAAERAKSAPKSERKMTNDELAAWADREIANTKQKTDALQYTRPAVGQAYDQGYGVARAAMMNRDASESPMANANRALAPSSYSYKPMAQKMAADPVARTAVYRDASESPMANANRALAPSSYSYKPEFRPPSQAPGEKNVGPMAQKMAADPVARTAVYRDPRSGMLAIDRDKALKLSLGAAGALQQQYDQQQAQIEELRRRQGVR
jgi:hypothetical protein